MSQLARSAVALGILTLVAANGAPGVARATEPDIKQVRKTLSLVPAGYLTVDTYKGSVTVRTWDKAEVDVQARVEPDGDGSDQRQAIQETEVRIEGSGTEVHVRSDYGKLEGHSWPNSWFNWTSWNLPFVRYEIHMPRTARLRIKDYKSDIRVEGLHAALDIDTYKGSTVVSSLDGPLKMQTYKGEARIEFLNVAGPSWVDTYKGDIEIAIPRGKGVNLASELGRHGTLDVDSTVAVGFQSAGTRRERYHGAVNGGGPELRLKTFRGSFRLRS